MVKVYIVEDDEVIRDTIRKHLSKWGFEIGVVEDFNNILQEFLAFEPQLVILDVIFLSLMAFIGVIKFEKFRMYPLSFYHHVIREWTK